MHVDLCIRRSFDNFASLILINDGGSSQIYWQRPPWVAVTFVCILDCVLLLIYLLPGFFWSVIKQ